jgi:hypothetical protein
MEDLPQGRRPARRSSRPLLLATAGLAVVKVACNNYVSGNLVAPPPCEENPNSPYCVDSGTDGGTDGGTADGGR